MQANWVTLTVMLVYCLGMIGIGVYFSKRVTSSMEFFIANRSLGPWVIAFSYLATYYSTVMMIGSPGFVYLQGMGYGIWAMIGSGWLFALLPFFYMAVPVRKQAERLGAYTVPDWLGNRYGSDAVRGLTAILIAVLIIPLCASILKGTGSLMQVLAGISYGWGVVLSGVVVLIYLMLSGFYGVCWTDYVQAIIMTVGLLLVFPIALYEAGGVSAMVQRLKDADPALVGIPGKLPWGQFITLSLIWGFTVPGTPQLLTRFMALRKNSMMRTCMIASATFGTLMIFLSYSNGILARALYPTEFLKSPDLVVPTLVYRMLPLWIAAIFVSAALAAAMSSLDSVALVAASSLIRDLYERVILKDSGRTVTERQMVNWSRVISVIIVGISIAMALKPPAIIFLLSAFTAGTLAAALASPVLYAIYWKRGNWQGALAATIGGTTVTLIWYIFKIPGLHPYVPGVITSLVLMPVVSLMTPAPAKELIDLAFETSKPAPGGRTARATTT